MKISEIVKLLDAKIVYGEEFIDREVNSACGSDMMSDVLAFVKNQAVLITGLCNPQVIRTAEMMDMQCVLFVRGKMPNEDMMRVATQKNIVLLSTPIRMYCACGMLYKAGLGVEDDHNV